MGNVSNCKKPKLSMVLHSCYDYNNINIKCANGKSIENFKKNGMLCSCDGIRGNLLFSLLIYFFLIFSYCSYNLRRISR